MGFYNWKDPEVVVILLVLKVKSEPTYPTVILKHFDLQLFFINIFGHRVYLGVFSFFIKPLSLRFSEGLIHPNT